MLSQCVRVAIVDNHVLFRKTLSSYLSDQRNIQVVTQAADMDDLTNGLKYSSADILIMDLLMPGVQGSEAVRSVHKEYPRIKILILSMSNDIETVSELMDSGIHGYISKSDEPDDLIKAIHAVAQNDIYQNRIFTEALYRSMQNNLQEHRKGPLVLLSEREKKILRLIWEEKSNKEIADLLFLGTRSVEKIRQDMKEKLGVKSTVGMLKYAVENKIVKTELRFGATATDRACFLK